MPIDSDLRKLQKCNAKEVACKWSEGERERVENNNKISIKIQKMISWFMTYKKIHNTSEEHYAFAREQIVCDVRSQWVSREYIGALASVLQTFSFRSFRINLWQRPSHHALVHWHTHTRPKHNGRFPSTRIRNCSICFRFFGCRARTLCAKRSINNWICGEWVLFSFIAMFLFGVCSVSVSFEYRTHIDLWTMAHTRSLPHIAAVLSSHFFWYILIYLY